MKLKVKETEKQILIFCFCLFNVSVNSQYTKLQSVFLARGKGRRSNLPAVEPNNALLLQLILLKREGNKSFDATASFLLRLLPECDLGHLRSLLVHVEENLRKVQESDRQAFLFEQFKLHTITMGPFLRETGVSQRQLLDACMQPAFLSLPTTGLLNELENIRHKETRTYGEAKLWWFQLTGQCVDEQQLKKTCQKIQKQQQKLRKNKHRPKGATDYQAFLASSAFPASSESHSFLPTSCAPVLSSSHSQPDPSSSNTDCLMPPGPQPDPSTSSTDCPVPTEPLRESHCHIPCHLPTNSQSRQDLVIKLAAKGRELASARRSIEVAKQSKDELQLKLCTLSSELKAKSLELDSERHRNQELKKVLEMRQSATSSGGKLKSSKSNADHVVLDLQRRLQYYQKQGHKKLIDRLKAKLNRQEQVTHQVAENEQRAKRKVRTLQVCHAELERQLRRAHKRLDTPKEPPVPEEPQAAAEFSVLRLKDERGNFKPEATVCVMQLVGECEVAASRCGTVIQAIAKHLFDSVVPDSDLPSTRSAIRFADRGHVLTKMHVSEALLEADDWDMHLDGTSRAGKKYVGHQMNVDGYMLSAGFSPASVENTTSLVDMSYTVLQELSEIFSDDHVQVQENFVTMLSKVCATMTDRASTMKSFSRQFDMDRKDMLLTDTSMEFLHCNAHVLLGVSSACDKVLKQTEVDSGEKFGRDKLAAFASFKSAAECSATR